MTSLTTDLPAPPPTAPDDLVGRLELAFRLLGKRIYLPGLRALRPGAAGTAGVDKASYPLLALLEEHDEVRPSDAAAALELDLSTVSRQIRHLETSGLVARRPDADDGRACRVRLTPDGRDGLSAVRRTRARLLDRALSDWPSPDREDLLRLLDRLLTSLRDTPPDGAHLDAAHLDAAHLDAAHLDAAHLNADPRPPLTPAPTTPPTETTR